MDASAPGRAARFGTLLLLVGLIAGCTPAASVGPSTTLAPQPSLVPATPVLTTAAPTTAPPPSTPEPSLTQLGLLRTPIAAPMGATHSGIAWTRIDPENELARLASMTRWSGGLIAAGDLVVSGGTARTPVWTSIDGTTWDALSPDVFGHAAVVLGIASTPSGIVALTARADAGPCEGDPLTMCIVLRWPVASWASTDGTTWTTQAPPELPAFTSLDQIALRSGPTGVLAFVRSSEGASLALSVDGSTWETTRPGTLPPDFELWDVDPFGAEWIATGIVWTGGDEDPFGHPTVLTSSDGRTWQARSVPIAGFPDRYGVEEIGSDVQRVYAARDGVIVTGGVQGAPSAETWWSSLDGHTWRAEPDYRPVGIWVGEGGSSGMSADGYLVANRSVMLAFRVEDHAGAWSSTDGRHWTAITMHGNPYEGPDSTSGRLLMTPVGIVWQQSNGRAWLAELLTE